MSSQEVTQPTDAPVPSKRRQKAPADPKDALENVLISAHRIAVSMGEMKVFSDANLSIAEWAVLRTIGDRKNVSLKEIGAAAGVSRQRMRKLLSDLQAKDLIAMGSAQGTDKRLRTVSSTAAAPQVLQTVSQQMQTLVVGGKGNQNRKLMGASRTLDKLGKQLRRSMKSAKGGRRQAQGGAASDADLDED